MSHYGGLVQLPAGMPEQVEADDFGFTPAHRDYHTGPWASFDIAQAACDYYILQSMVVGSFGARSIGYGMAQEALARGKKHSAPIHYDGEPACALLVEAYEAGFDADGNHIWDVTEEVFGHANGRAFWQWQLETVYMPRTESIDIPGFEASELDRLIAEAQRRLVDLVNDLVPVLYEYGPWAIAGEVSYHGLFAQWVYCQQSTNNNKKNDAWRAFRDLMVAVGTEQAYRYAAAFFGDGGWSPSFGGKNWQTCAEVYADHFAGVYSREVFCDRVFSLQHNTGSFLNKVGWYAKNAMGWTADHMKSEVLPAHGDDDYAQLLRGCSVEVANLFQDAWFAAGNEQTIKEYCDERAEKLANIKKAELTEQGLCVKCQSDYDVKVDTDGFAYCIYHIAQPVKKSGEVTKPYGYDKNCSCSECEAYTLYVNNTTKALTQKCLYCGTSMVKSSGNVSGLCKQCNAKKAQAAQVALVKQLQANKSGSFGQYVKGWNGSKK